MSITITQEFDVELTKCTEGKKGKRGRVLAKKTVPVKARGMCPLDSR